MKTKNYILFSILTSFLILVGSCQANTALIQADDLEEMMMINDNIQLIDVRTPEEFQEGHLENATNINWNDKDFALQTQDLNKEEPIYLYCKSGRRSAAAAQQLTKEGFEVYDLKGGIDYWMNNNYPVTK